MKLSNREMIEKLQSLKTVAQKELPVKASYSIEKNLMKLQSELKPYFAQRQKLVDKYAEKDEKGNPKADKNGQLQFSGENREKWDKDIKDLLDITSEVPIRKFKLSELNGRDLSVAELSAIDYMIEDA
jgi:hypothetical protein